MAYKELKVWCTHAEEILDKNTNTLQISSYQKKPYFFSTKEEMAGRTNLNVFFIFVFWAVSGFYSWFLKVKHLFETQSELYIE